MSRFILRENLRRYRSMLEEAREARTRGRLQSLISETERELFFHERIWVWTCPHIAVPDALGAGLESLLDRIVAADGADLGSLQLWDAETESLRLLAHNGFDRESAQQFAVVQDGVGSTCEAAQSLRRRILIEDTHTAQGFAATVAWSVKKGVRAIQSTPVFHDDRFLGVFSTYFRTPRAFAEAPGEVSAWHARQVAELLGRIGAT